MNKGIGIALLVGGIVMVLFGLNASESFASDVSRTFTGTPTDKSLWLIISGAVLAIVGLFVSFKGSKPG
jgi:hypothetical protein